MTENTVYETEYNFLEEQGSSFNCFKCKKTETWTTIENRDEKFDEKWRYCTLGCSRLFCLGCVSAVYTNICMDCSHIDLNLKSPKTKFINSYF